MGEPRDQARPTELASMRRTYDVGSLERSTLAEDPIEQFRRWFADAHAAGADEPNAMTLATVDADRAPDARTVLLKGLDEHGFTWFTNYDSAKGDQLALRAVAALVFRWFVLERQVRVRGTVVRTTSQESDAYFATRPLGSRIGAVVSPQSRVIDTRQQLEQDAAALQDAHADGDIARPAHWGGYRLTPDVVEFWQGRPDRLHDRFRYTRSVAGWTIERLAP